MSETSMESFYSSFLDVCRGVEVGLTDLQMHNILSLLFESLCLCQHFKGCFSSENFHPFREYRAHQITSFMQSSRTKQWLGI